MVIIDPQGRPKNQKAKNTRKIKISPKKAAALQLVIHFQGLRKGIQRKERGQR